MLTNDNAIVWSLHIPCWDGKRHDPSLSREINASYDADRDAGTYTRKIVPPAMLNRVNRSKQNLRDSFNDITHPYAAKGSRVSSKARYFEVKAAIEKGKLEYLHEVDHFIREYTAWLASNGPQNFMKNMYQPNIHPEPSQLRKRFGVEFTVVPYTVAPTGDSELDTTLQEEFDKAQLKEDSDLRADISNRIYKIVSNIYQRLMSDGKFRKEPFESLMEKASLIETLNIFNDSRIDSIARDARALANLDLKELRKDEFHRADAANAANNILKKLNNLRNVPSDTTKNTTGQNGPEPQPPLVLNGAVPPQVPTI